MDFEAKFLQYQKNVFPSMVEALAGDLGVSVKSINKLGIGFYPAWQSFVWAERDAKGNIIGLGHRLPDGKKRMEEGSKRGLVYECAGRTDKKQINKNIFAGGGFVRAYNAGVDCPLCGKQKWCLVSNDNPHDPSTVICGHTDKGAARYIENSGYLHFLKPQNNSSRTMVLSNSDKPYIVVEGFSDVLATMDMGYVAIGRPSATGGSKLLSSLLRGQEIIIVGENDDAGRHGALKIFQALKGNASSVRKVFPPPEFKDLRQWHPTADVFETWINQHAEEAEKDRILDSDDPRRLAAQWLEENFETPQGTLLHYYNDEWWKYIGFQYQKISTGELNASLISFLSKYEVLRNFGQANVCMPLRMTKRFIGDVRFNLEALCHLKSPDNSYRPFRISDYMPIDTTQAIAFQNGIYHVADRKFEVTSPDLFIVSPLPYDFNPDAPCPEWAGVSEDMFNADEKSLMLLQEWFGYNMLASNHMESMMFLYGGRAAGKSTTVDVLQAVLGLKNCAARDTADFVRQFGLEDAANKHAVIISEDQAIGRDRIKVLSKIKQITGQDTIPITRKYKGTLDVKPYFKITYVANELLYFKDESGAFLRRLNLLHFPNCYADQPDRRLKSRLVKEAPGIAMWAIKGLERLLETDRFTVPDKSKEHLTDIQQLSNPLQSMFSEHCLVKPGEFTPTNELFDLHKAVYEENDMSPLPKNQFNVRLKSALPDGAEKSRQRVSGELVYGYANLVILPSAYRRYLGRP